jgi:hexulose-6-phosphate isomerase
MNTLINSRIGFMQGRLSPMIDGRIQSFPWDYWENEFSLAKEIGI